MLGLAVSREHVDVVAQHAADEAALLRVVLLAAQHGEDDVATLGQPQPRRRRVRHDAREHRGGRHAARGQQPREERLQQLRQTLRHRLAGRRDRPAAQQVCDTHTTHTGETHTTQVRHRGETQVRHR